MPRKNGKEVYDEIKKIQPEMEALFMSGYTDDILSGRGIIEENLSFISKPLVQNIFLQKVREILDKRAVINNILLQHVG
jgi:response regulator RpfG family c-di-GMP phosphodiesterase